MAIPTVGIFGRRKAVAAPKSTHKHSQPTANATAEDIQTQIQKLAYQLWLERGTPIGSPEQDWHDAEQRLIREGKSEK